MKCFKTSSTSFFLNAEVASGLQQADKRFVDRITGCLHAYRQLWYVMQRSILQPIEKPLVSQVESFRVHNFIPGAGIQAPLAQALSRNISR